MQQVVLADLFYNVAIKKEQAVITLQALHGEEMCCALIAQ